MFIKVTLIRRYKEKGEDALVTDPWITEEHPQYLSLDVVEAFRINLEINKIVVVYRDAENSEKQDELKDTIAEIKDRLIKLELMYE